MIKKQLGLLILSLVLASSLFAQDEKSPTLKLPMDGELKLSFLNQTWVRYTKTNPGSTVFGDETDQIWDVGLRRTRMVLSGRPIDRVFVFAQIGMNNFNYIAPRKSLFFVHDAVADYKFTEAFHLGSGLTAWGGFSRFSAPSVGSIMGVDAPLVAQATNDANDQFVRRLSVFAKGEINKFHYRVAISKPLAIERSSQNTTLSVNRSTYSTGAPSPQIHGYFEYSFFDQEVNNSPYKKGTYHGKKKVLNIGIGALYQKDAMNMLDSDNNTITTDLSLLALDVFYDSPLNNEGAINFYAAYFLYDFGDNYIRNVGAMNPANGNNDNNVVNGPGSAFPMIGTGSIVFVQAGYLFPFVIGEKTRIMPYASTQISSLQALEQTSSYFDAGVNVLLNGHKAKLTLAYQNRPIFRYNDEGVGEIDSRAGLVIAQFQVAI